MKEEKLCFFYQTQDGIGLDMKYEDIVTKLSKQRNLLGAAKRMASYASTEFVLFFGIHIFYYIFYRIFVDL